MLRSATLYAGHLQAALDENQEAMLQVCYLAEELGGPMGHSAILLRILS
jgi:hypothetical protein